MPTPANQHEARMEIPAAGQPATALLGNSQMLGECRIGLNGIDRLLLGGAIEQEAAQLAPQGWTLHHARLPKIASTESGNRIPGTAAALVGHSAPDFQLELHGGETFRLRDCLGQIVVLDFWASWCGPCMQTMPQIERLVRELPGDQVRLVAVNLQETPDEITSTLQRHGLETVVALDQDGVVAEKYTATAIPQTVVIDQQGNIARLFVGGGPRLVGQLRAALEGMLEKGKPSGPCTEP
jgi:thiol-disulfide isomerase/thioredoxin